MLLVWYSFFLGHSFLLSFSFFLLDTIILMFFEKNFCEKFLAILAWNKVEVTSFDFLLSLLFILINAFLVLLSIILFDSFNSCSEIFRGCFPVISSFIHPHFTLVGILLVLLENLGLLLRSEPLGLWVELLPFRHKHNFACFGMLLKGFSVELSATSLRTENEFILIKFNMHWLLLFLFLFDNGNFLNLVPFHSDFHFWRLLCLNFDSIWLCLLLLRFDNFDSFWSDLNFTLNCLLLGYLWRVMQDQFESLHILGTFVFIFVVEKTMFGLWTQTINSVSGANAHLLGESRIEFALEQSHRGLCVTEGGLIIEPSLLIFGEIQFQVHLLRDLGDRTHWLQLLLRSFLTEIWQSWNWELDCFHL